MPYKTVRVQIPAVPPQISTALLMLEQVKKRKGREPTLEIPVLKGANPASTATNRVLPAISFDPNVFRRISIQLQNLFMSFNKNKKYIYKRIIVYLQH
jgi:hypothetical protein